MRINKYVALATGMSRRASDKAIADGRVTVNGKAPGSGDQINTTDTVQLDGISIQPATQTTTIMLNKPTGYVVSRDGQGSKTIYDLLPKELHSLKPVGRLDKESSGLLLLTNDGDLANKLTHPRYNKQKVYEVTLDHDLSEADFETITKKGVELDDGPSKFQLDFINDGNTQWKVTMSEGRNRQIRRTFAQLGYTIQSLHRTHFGDYKLEKLSAGQLLYID